jgi:hypothetical protein
VSYNATSSLVRFKNKNICFLLSKNALAYVSRMYVLCTYVGLFPGAIPTILSNNTSALKYVYNAASSLERFDNKNIFLHINKNALAFYNAMTCA